MLENRLKFKNNVSSDNDPFRAGLEANSRTADNMCSLIQQMNKMKTTFLYTCIAETFDYIDRNALI